MDEDDIGEAPVATAENDDDVYDEVYEDRISPPHTTATGKCHAYAQTTGNLTIREF